MADKTLPVDVMSPAEFKAFRDEMGLSIEHTALLLNLASARTIRRYEDGEREVSGPVGVLMKLFADVAGAADYADHLARERAADARGGKPKAGGSRRK